MEEPVYLDTKSILVSTQAGLKRLQVPFLVCVVIDIEGLKVGDKTKVELVSYNKKTHLLYFIEGIYYKYYFFVIIDKRLEQSSEK